MFKFLFLMHYFTRSIYSLSDQTMKRFLLFLSCWFICSSLSAQRIEATNLTEQQRYLMKFKSVFFDVAPTADWDAYLKQYDVDHPAPEYVQPNTKQASERNALYLEQDKPKLSLLAPHFQIQYLYRFYGNEFMKLKPDNTQFAYANEFDIRKWAKEGKKRMVEDAAKLPYGQELFVRGKAMQRSRYDFDNQCFYVTPDFSDLIGFPNIEWPQYHAIYINFIEEYQALLEKIKVPLPEDQAELLFSELDLPASIGNQRVLIPKLIFSISNEKSENPVYVTGNGYNYHTFYPLKYKPIALEIEFFDGSFLRKVIHRIELFPKPDEQVRGIQSGMLETKGTPRRISWVVNAAKEPATETTTSSTTDPATDNERPSYDFLRPVSPGSKKVIIEYLGGAKNADGSEHQVGLLRLSMAYNYYLHHLAHFPIIKRNNFVIAALWLELKDEERVIGQNIDKYDTKKGELDFYRLFIGDGAYGKPFRKAGYKKGYCDLKYNEDHTINLQLFDQKGKLQFTAKLKPLAKDITPIIGNN